MTLPSPKDWLFSAQSFAAAALTLFVAFSEARRRFGDHFRRRGILLLHADLPCLGWRSAKRSSRQLTCVEPVLQCLRR
jgi:hypothetical protein